MHRAILGIVIASLLVACRSPDPIERQDMGQTLPDSGPIPDTPKVELPPFDPGSGETLVDSVGEMAPDATDVSEAVADIPIDVGTPIPRKAEITFRYRPNGPVATVTVPGDFNGWSPTALPMSDPEQDGEWTATLDASAVSPGDHGYKFLVNGTEWIQDPRNPLILWDDGKKNENSKVIVPDFNLPLLQLVSASADWTTKSVTVEVSVETGVKSQPLDPASLRVRLNGQDLPGQFFDGKTQRFKVQLADRPAGKYSFVFEAANAAGPADPLFVPIWLEEKPFSWTDAVLYFAFTDRFFDGNPANSAPSACTDAKSPTNWLGGDWEGIRQKIEAGYFDDLGVNAIWISSPNDNPDGCYKGDLKEYSYTAYHGYFPLSLDQPENHFGTLEDLKAMVQAAHDRGIRVLMDLAANHVHEDSEIFKQHKDWFHQTVLLCGDGNNWNEHPIDCWFMPYLPDLDYTNNDAVNAFTDSAVAWAVEANLDGFRVDAVKHMVHNFTKTLRYKLHRDIETTDLTFYLVGETFAGDWDWSKGCDGDNPKIIKAYINDWELHGQFDFPLFWEFVKFVRGEGEAGRLGDVFQAARDCFGKETLMSNFLGNHDVARIISHAYQPKWDMWCNGSKEIGVTDPPKLPDGPEPFEKVRAAFAVLMTLPGIPLLYYGDEVGLPGAGDPDNRRMMPFEGLTEHQKALKADIGKLGKLRAAHPATRTGDFRKLAGDKDTLVFVVYGGGDAVLTAVNRGSSPANLTLSIPAETGLSGTLTDALGGGNVTVSGGQATVTVPARGAVVLVGK